MPPSQPDRSASVPAPDGSYAYAWEYRVRPEADDEFRRQYGPTGSWVTLFRQGVGYVSTELYRDRDDPCRYLTVDTWASKRAYDRFRARFAEEFDALDRTCADLTEHEARLGVFDRWTTEHQGG